MKLHLPSGLRSALFACFAAVTALSTTIATATITGGVFAVIVAGSAVHAANYIGGYFQGSQIGCKLTESGEAIKINSNTLTTEDTVTFDGISGWLSLDPQTYNANFHIAAGGLTLTDGSSGRIHTFNGALSGTGAFEVKAANPSGSGLNNRTFTFNGDTTNYTGALSVGGSSQKVNFNNTGEAQRKIAASTLTVAGTTKITGNYEVSSVMNLNSLTLAVPSGDNAPTSSAVSFTGAGSTITALTVNENVALTLGANASLTLGGATINGTLANNGTLTLGGTVVLRAGIANNGTLTLSEGATIDLSNATFAEQGGTYSLALVTGGGTVTGLDLSTLNIVLADGLAGKVLTITDGVLSYVVTAANLTFSAETLTWQDGVAMDGGSTFAQGDMVTFSGTTEATLAASVSSARVTVAEGATLSLSNGGNEDNVLSAANIDIYGSLVLKDAVLAADAHVSADGTGSVVIDAAPAANLEFASQLADFTGALIVQGGRYSIDTEKTTPFASISVTEGGQLNVNSNYSGAITIEGNGIGEEAYRNTAMRLGSNTVSAKVTVAGGGASLAVYDSNTGTISGELAGTGSLTKTEGGTLKLTGNITNTGALNIQGGRVTIGSGPTSSNTMSFSQINVGNNSTLEFHHGGANFSGTDLTLSAGATLHIEDSNCGNTVPMPEPESKAIALGKLTMLGNAKLTWTWKGAVSFTELTGTGNIEMSGPVKGNDPRATVISLMNNYSGTISGAPDKHILYLGAVHQEAGYTAVVKDAGTIHLNDFVKTDTGNLALVGNVAASGVLTMNYEGGLFSDEAMSNAGLNITSVADNTRLTYLTSGATLNLNYSVIADTVLGIDLTAMRDTIPADGFDLGITGATAADVTSLENRLNVLCVAPENWTLALGNNGNVFLKIAEGAGFETLWDFNWGADGLESQPRSTTSLEAPSNYTSLGADYLVDGVVAVTLTGTAADASNVVIIGGAGSPLNADKTDAVNNSGAAFTGDTWIDVQGGNYSLIVGGNYANNWNGGNASHFNGDSHIAMKGGSVQYILGGNYKDGATAWFNGDTYISIFEGAEVKGSIIGSGVSTHSVGSKMNGNTNIYIYTPLSSNEGTVALNGSTPNAVIGSSLHATNQGVTMHNTGSTNITVDLSKYSGTAEFVKMLVGGDFLAVDRNDTSLIEGGTNITVSAGADVTFTANIVGGTRLTTCANNSSATVKGDSNIALYGGTMGNGTNELLVVGGMLTSNDYTRTGYTLSVGGSSNILLDGAVLSANANIIAGSYVANKINSATITLGGSNVQLTSGTVGGYVTGGHYITGDGGTTFGTASVGDVSLAVQGAAVSGDIYGGSYNNRKAAAAQLTQGNITVDLLSGSVSNVYAAGYQAGTATMTTASTTVNLSSGITLADGAVISGGYKLGDGAANATVAGRSTLVFADASYSNLGNATFRDFNTVNVAANSVVDANIEVAATASLAKTGAGTLKLGGADVAGTLVVQEGTLALKPSTSLTATTVMGGATLDASAAAGSSGGALTLGGTAGDVVNLNLGSGLAVDSLALTGGAMMNVLGADALGSDYTLTLFTGLTPDIITGIIFGGEEGRTATLADYISNAADFTGAELILTADGALVITTQGAGGSWKWNDATGGTWSATSVEDWIAGNGTSPEDNKVVFGNEGIAAGGTTTIAISGPVAPAQVTVNANSGEYIFTDDGNDATADGIGGAASLVKSGAGKLTISLANTYSGGTTINAGTLEATVEGALGSGDVALNGGTLSLSAALSNKIVFGGGTLQYAYDASLAYATLGRTDAGTINVEVAKDKTATWTSTVGDGINTANFFGNGMTLTGEGTLKLVFEDYKFIGNSDATFTINGNLLLDSNSAGNNMELYTKLAGNGTVTLHGMAGAVSLHGDNSGFAGTLELTNDDIDTGIAFLFVNALSSGGEQTTLHLNGAVFRSDANTIGAGTVLVDGVNLLRDNAAAERTMSGDFTGSGTLKLREGSTLNLTGSMVGFSGVLSDNGAAATFNFGSKPGEGAVAATADASGNLFADGASLTGTSAAHYRFNYSNPTLNLNAVLSGDGTSLTQNGTGVLVLTQDNTATGTLTVNSGTVAIGAAGDSAQWAGAYDVNGTGVLEIANVTGQSVTGAIVADATATVKVTGTAVTLASLQGGKLESSGALTIASNATVAELANTGVIRLESTADDGTVTRYGLTIQGGTTAGGDIVADQIVMGGDCTFGELDVANGLMSSDGNVSRNLTLNGDSTISGTFGPVKTLTSNGTTTLKKDNMYLRGDLVGTGSVVVEQGQLTLESGTANLDGSASASGNVNLNGTGAHRFGGDLTVGGTLTLAGTLNVGGTLSGLDTIVLNGNGLAAPDGPVPGFSAGAGREITVGTLNVASDLTLQLRDDAMIESLGLRNGSSYTLLAANALQVGGQAVSDTNQLLLKLGVSGMTGTMTDTYAIGSTLYTIECVNNAIVLTASVAGNEWKDDVNAPVGEWSSSNYEGGSVPSEQETAAFLGSGPATVQVSADGVEVGKVVVDTTLAGEQQHYDQETYTFAGGAVTTGGLAVSAGGLEVGNDVSVETSGGDANRSSWTGTVVVGDASTPDLTAVLTVAEGATLSAESLTVHSQNGFVNEGTTEIASTAQVTSIANEGTMSVAGALEAGSVSNSGVLSAGANSNIGMLVGTGAATVGDGSTIGTVAGAQSLTAGAGANISAVTGVTTVAVGEKSTLGDVVGTEAGADAVTVGGGSTVTSVSAVESLTVGGGSTVTTAEGVNTLVADGSGTSGTVSVSTVNAGLTELAANGANLEIATVGTTAGEVSGTIGKVTAAAGSEVKLTGTGAVEIGALVGNGTFSAADADVTLTGTPTGLMNVTAKSLDLTQVSGSGFGVVTADAYTLNVADFAADAVPAALMMATSLGNTDITLALTGVDALVQAAANALAAGGADSVDYTLISQLDAQNAASLNVELADAAKIHQLFAQAGKYNAGLLPEANATSLFATAVAVGQNVVLRVSTEAERVWNTADDFAGELDFNGIDDWYTRLAYVDKVNVNQTTTIDLTNLNGVDSTYDATTTPAGLNVQNLTGSSALTIKGSADDLATLTNKENTTLSNTLTIEGAGFQANVAAEGGATLSVNELALAGGATLNVDDTATVFAGKLTAADAAAGTLSGKVNVTGEGGRYMGSWNNATVNMAAAGASQTLAPAAGLTVTGAQGTAILDYSAGNATMGAINTTGAHVKLDNIGAEGQMNVLTLASASSMQGGELTFGVNAAEIAQAVNSGSAVPAITEGAALDLSGTCLNVTQADASVQRVAFNVSQGTEGLTLFTISADGSMDGVTVSFGENDQFFSRYFTNVEVRNGKVVADLVTDYYAGEMGMTENGSVGLEMMDAAFLALNPQGASDAAGANPQYKDLAGVLNSLDEYRRGNGAMDDAADKLGAAVAGSGVASVGMALSGDMERQLRAIRNRTTTMGVDPNVINEDMPYFNAWINAEGDHRSLDADSTYAGYKLTSWGGTVGFDMDVNDMFTWGLAVTAMYGDFSAESADAVEGDMDTYYVSAFARGMSGAWVHTFVASVGLSYSDLSRTVSHNYGSYTAEGEADGMSFGLLYEVARTFALNEDATACWQPVFNVAYRHIEVDGYSETGSDAGLSVGDQSLDTLTVGIGGRFQSVVGENIYNRTSVFEARALVKFDAGDRESEMETALLNLPSARGTVRSAEMDAFGIELGAGLTVPVGFDAGSIFLDGSVEFRGSSTNANATFGYRVNF